MLVGERWRDVSGNVIKESRRLAGAEIDYAKRNLKGASAVRRRWHQPFQGSAGFVEPPPTPGLRWEGNRRDEKANS